MTIYTVTGGAGFIGSHIADALLKRGETVRVLDNFSTGKRANVEYLKTQDNHNRLTVIEGDVREMDAVSRAVTGADYLIHQAALVSVPQSIAEPATTHAVNVSGVLNLLTAARESHVRRVVLASSCAVYGDNEALPLRETSQTKPLSPYAASKLIGEVYYQTFYRAYGVPTVCLRYMNIYGPRQDPNGEYAAVIAKFAHRMRAGQAPIIYGDGLQTRDFVHVSDVVRANLLVCERDEAIGQVFNVASGRGISLLDLVDILNELYHTDFRPHFEPPRAGDIRHSRGDGALIAAQLGFTPQLPLLEGLKQLYG